MIKNLLEKYRKIYYNIGITKIENEESGDMKTESGEIKGTDITSVYTLKSWYDNDSVGVRTSEGEFRITASELIKILSDYDYDWKRAKVHKYLEAKQVKGC